MATVLLGALGGAIGTGIGGTILGVTTAAIGQAVGAAVGRMIDQSFIAMLTPDEQIHGPRVGKVGLALPREGEMLARGAGWQKLPARIMWPADLQFTEESESVSTGGKGAQNKSTTTTYYAEVSLAIAIHDGEVDMLGRAWADGSAVNLADLCNSVTVYKGTATQDPDPTIEAFEGAGNVPDWRGITYIVLDGLNLESFGNRIPQFEFEVFKATSAAPQAFQGLTLLPTAGEFGFDPHKVTERAVETINEASGPEEVVVAESPVNNNAVAASADIKTALDMLAIQHPQVEQILVEYPWFGDDLRCGNCEIKPRVEMATRETSPDTWSVQGISRGVATIVSQVDSQGAFSGTPSDAGVVRLIEDLRDRGYSVTLSPLVLMDIPLGNGLSDPYGAAEQSAFPNRSMITCDPAPEMAGTVNKTAAASTQVDAYFGGAVAADFLVSGQVVSYTGPDDWGYSRFVLHCAALVKAGGGLESFLIGSGLKGLTTVRSDATTFPAVAKMVALLGEVRTALAGVESGEPAIVRKAPASADGVNLPDRGLTSGTAIEAWYGDSVYNTYPRHADFTEGGVVFEVGPDGYLLEHGSGTQQTVFVDTPLPDGNWFVDVSFEHARSPGTAAGIRTWAVKQLKAGVGILGGDITAGKSVSSYAVTGLVPWTVEGYTGYARLGGDYLRFSYYMYNWNFLFRELTITLTKLISLGYAADLEEYGAYNPSDGSGDVLFPLDPLWSDIDCDFVGINYAPPLADIRDGDPESVYDLALLSGAIEAGELYDWHYASEADRQARTRTAIEDLVHGEPWIFRAKDLFGWWSNAHHERPAGVRSGSATAFDVSGNKVRIYYGCPAIDRAANQPGAEVNSLAGAYALPHFSNGARDDESQATYNRAIAEFWAADARGMVDAAGSCLSGWDARPWPVFPHTDLWPDAAAWPIGRAISGRRQVEVAAWLADELEYRGLDYEIDQITGSIDGVTIDNLAGFGSVVAPILDIFHLDATEVDGKVKITSRVLQVATHTIDLEAVIPLSKEDRYRAPRANPGQIPAIAYLTHTDIGHDYDSNTVNSRLNQSGNGDSSTEVPILIDPQIGRDLIRAKHLDGIVALDSFECELPPSWLPRLVPGSAIFADLGRGANEWLILKREIGAGIKIATRRLDRAAIRPNPTRRTGYQAPQVAGPGSTAFAMPDLPWLASSDPAHDLRTAIWVDPAQGNGLMRSRSESTGFAAVGSYATRTTMGVLTADFAAGSPYLWDRGNTLSLRLFSGSLISKPELDVRAGQNWLAVRTDAAANTWELLGFVNAELTAVDSYDLSQLLRGLRGSQIAVNVPAGAIVVLLENLQFAGVELDEVGLPFWWAAGPSAKPRTDASWLTRQITPNAAGLKPFAPARLSGEIIGSDLSLTWQRQDRDPRADQLDRASIPMSEEALLYTVSIAGITWSVGGESATILAVDLPVAPYLVTVQQVSADVGLGHPANITME